MQTDQDELLIWQHRECVEHERRFYPDAGLEFEPPARLRIVPAEEQEQPFSLVKILMLAASLAFFFVALWFIWNEAIHS